MHRYAPFIKQILVGSAWIVVAWITSWEIAKVDRDAGADRLPDGSLRPTPVPLPMFRPTREQSTVIYQEPEDKPSVGGGFAEAINAAKNYNKEGSSREDIRPRTEERYEDTSTHDTSPEMGAMPYEKRGICEIQWETNEGEKKCYHFDVPNGSEVCGVVAPAPDGWALRAPGGGITSCRELR